MAPGHPPRVPHSVTLTLALLVLVAVFVLAFDKLLGWFGLGS